VGAQQGGGASADPALAKRGSKLFVERGCLGCHSIGKGKRAGPDLSGVTQRRSVDWLKTFLKDNERMLSEDPTAMALVKEYNYQRMRISKLSTQEVEALVSYLVRENTKGGA
jgi:mono/diheme cytochrome c family protein